MYPCNGILFGHKKEEVLVGTITRMNLENIMLGERSQTQKATHFVIYSHKMSKTSKSIQIESRLVVARVWRQGKPGVTANGRRVSF